MATVRAVCFFAFFVFWVSVVRSADLTINVWVHGTNPAPEKIWMHERSPARPWLYAQPGLHLSSGLPENYYFHRLGLLCQKSCAAWSAETFYVYGWPSTIPSAATRKIEGNKLFNSLNSLIEEQSKEYESIKIRLVGFSHGGNVILNMISCLPFFASGVELEVVFLGTPVQEATRDLINSPWVKRAYSFYTKSDWMQRIDMQKLQNLRADVPWFSQKVFHYDDQIIQIKLTIDGVSIGHRDYRSINHFLPKILQQLDVLLPKDRKSDHIEFDFATRSENLEACNA